jgi:hypothetical protein
MKNKAIKEIRKWGWKITPVKYCLTLCNHKYPYKSENCKCEEKWILANDKELLDFYKKGLDEDKEGNEETEALNDIESRIRKHKPVSDFEKELLTMAYNTYKVPMKNRAIK